MGAWHELLMESGGPLPRGPLPRGEFKKQSGGIRRIYVDRERAVQEHGRPRCDLG